MPTNLKPIKIYLTNKFNVPNKCKWVTVGTLNGHTGSGAGTYIVELLPESLCGVVYGSGKINVFNATSNTSADPIVAQQRTIDSMTQKIFELSDSINNNKLVAFLIGGLGKGAKANPTEIEQSRNLINNVAYSVEDCIPEREGIKVPLLTICGKRDYVAPTRIYVRKNLIAIEDPALFSKLFNKKTGKCILRPNGLLRFLKKHCEYVQMLPGVNLIAEKDFNPKKNPREYQAISLLG